MIHSATLSRWSDAVRALRVYLLDAEAARNALADEIRNAYLKAIRDESKGPFIDRRPVTPSFSVTAVPEDSHALLERCLATIAEVRFDATALPVSDLRFEARLEGVVLVVEIRVPDRDKPNAVEWIFIWRSLLCPWYVLRSNGPDYLVRWMRETVANTLAHEVDESITLEDVRVFDPHRPLRVNPTRDADLASITNEARATAKATADAESVARAERDGVLGLVLPGWTCVGCLAFNGSEKELLEQCRCCGMERPR